jgi:hypothetical protein
MFSYANFIHKPLPLVSAYKEPRSKDFSVWVNGTEVPVYTCRISKIPFNRPWPGKQRSIDQTEQASFVSLVSDEVLHIEVATPLSYEKVIIKPYSKKVEHKSADGKIVFTLHENGHYVLQLDSYHHTLYLYNSKPVEAPAPHEVTHFFGAGVHFAGKITLHSDESVYIDKDALVFGNVYAENAKNIRIFGNGLLDDSCEERVASSCYAPYTVGNMKFYDCEDISIEGVLMRNSAIWCINLFHCFGVKVDNVKIFGQWRYNTDGVDIVNSQNIAIQNSFIHSFDDTVSIKGIDRYALTDVENISVDNCVLWCDWGKPCEVGVETACREYKHISFTNCDILRGGNAVLDVNNGDCAEISDVLFENIHVDYNAYDTIEVFQNTDEQTYDAENTIMIPHLIWIGNRDFRNREAVTMKGIPPGAAVGLDLTGIRRGMNRDVVCRNIHVHYDERIPRVNGKYNLPICVTSIYPDIIHDNILITNITVNGKPLKEKDAMISILRAERFRFEEGSAESSESNINS